MKKLHFQNQLLQFSVPHYQSEIILICYFDTKEAFHININVENSSAFMEKLWPPPPKDSLINKMISIYLLVSL